MPVSTRQVVRIDTRDPPGHWSATRALGGRASASSMRRHVDRDLTPEQSMVRPDRMLCVPSYRATPVRKVDLPRATITPSATALASAKHSVLPVLTKCGSKVSHCPSFAMPRYSTPSETGNDARRVLPLGQQCLAAGEPHDVVEQRGNESTVHQAPRVRVRRADFDAQNDPSAMRVAVDRLPRRRQWASAVVRLKAGRRHVGAHGVSTTARWNDSGSL